MSPRGLGVLDGLPDDEFGRLMGAVVRSCGSHEEHKQAQILTHQDPSVLDRTIVKPRKLEHGCRRNSARIPYTVL